PLDCYAGRPASARPSRWSPASSCCCSAARCSPGSSASGLRPCSTRGRGSPLQRPRSWTRRASVGLMRGRVAGLLAAFAVLGLLAWARTGWREYDGPIRRELTAPTQLSVEGPAICRQGPDGFMASAAAPLQAGTDLLSPGVGSMPSLTVAIAVNNQDG